MGSLQLNQGLQQKYNFLHCSSQPNWLVFSPSSTPLKYFCLILLSRVYSFCPFMLCFKYCLTPTVLTQYHFRTLLPILLPLNLCFQCFTFFGILFVSERFRIWFSMVTSASSWMIVLNGLLRNHGYPQVKLFPPLTYPFPLV